MDLGKSIAIFEQIENDKYDLQEKGQAIYDVLNMETHNSITKAMMLKVIKWLLELSFDLPKTE